MRRWRLLLLPTSQLLLNILLSGNKRVLTCRGHPGGAKHLFQDNSQMRWLLRGICGNDKKHLPGCGTFRQHVHSADMPISSFVLRSQLYHSFFWLHKFLQCNRAPVLYIWGCPAEGGNLSMLRHSAFVCSVYKRYSKRSHCRISYCWLSGFQTRWQLLLHSPFSDNR